MTDIVALTKALFMRIEWQEVPREITNNELTIYIAEAIRWLYTMTGRARLFNEEWFTLTEAGDGYVSFEYDLPLDEREYVLVTAQINYLRMAQSDVDTMTSYSTDAMSVTNGDKPYANLQQTITDLTLQQQQIWYKMNRFHHLGGVSV